MQAMFQISRKQTSQVEGKDDLYFSKDCTLHTRDEHASKRNFTREMNSRSIIDGMWLRMIAIEWGSSADNYQNAKVISGPARAIYIPAHYNWILITIGTHARAVAGNARVWILIRYFRDEIRTSRLLLLTTRYRVTIYLWKVTKYVYISEKYTVLDRIKWIECTFWIIFSFICYVSNKLETFNVENVYRHRKYIFSI